MLTYLEHQGSEMANVTDIRTRRRISKRSLGKIVSLAAMRVVERTAPYGLPIDGAHCRRAYSISEIRRALKDGYSVDEAGSTHSYLLMVKRL